MSPMKNTANPEPAYAAKDLSEGVNAFIWYAKREKLTTQGNQHFGPAVGKFNPSSTPVPEMYNALEKIAFGEEAKISDAYSGIPADLQIPLHQFMAGWNRNEQERLDLEALQAKAADKFSAKSFFASWIPKSWRSQKSKQTDAYLESMEELFEAGKKSKCLHDAVYLICNLKLQTRISNSALSKESE